MKKICKKMCNRLLAILLALSLCCSICALDINQLAYAEEAVIEPAEQPAPTEAAVSTAEPTAEPTVEPTAEPTVEPTTEPTVEPTTEPTAEPTIEPTVEPTLEPSVEPTLEPTSEPTPEAPTVDYAHDASYSPAFQQGFACVLADGASLYGGRRHSDAELGSIGKGVVYAVARSSSQPDRLLVMYHSKQKAALEGAWIAAEDIRPMDGSVGGEVESYLSACAKEEQVLYYNDDPALPLLPLELRYAQKPQEPLTAQLKQSAAVIGVGDSGFRLELVFSDGAAHEVRFESSRPKYAKVDSQSGVVTGVKAGTATITAVTECGSYQCSITVKKAPKRISLSPATNELAIGESLALATSFGGSSYGGSVRYESSNTAVATVDAQGNVTAIAKGTAVIRAYAYNLPSKPAQAVVNVLGQATQIFLSDESVSLYAGTEHCLAVSFPENERDSVRFSSSDEAVLRVDADGCVHALAAGSATITASCSGGASASCIFTVLAAPLEEDILLLQASRSLGLKESFSMAECIQVSGEAEAIFTYVSSKPKIASVDAKTGVVTGLKKGSSVIRASSQNGITRDLKVTVCANPRAAAFSQKSIVVGVGAQLATKLRFTPSSAYSSCAYYSSNGAIATVDASGVVTGVAIGTATIYVDPAKGKSGSCRVTVVPAPQQISVEQASIDMGVGESGRLVAGVCPAGSMCSFSYASSNESIVRVDAQSGMLTAIAAGSADIIVRSHNGVQASCRVQVYNAPQSVRFNAAVLPIMLGERSSALTASVNDGAYSAITLTSSNTRYVKIVDGELVGVRKGSATVTATTYNGMKASCLVRVYDKPKSIAFAEAEISLGCGESYALDVNIKPSSAYSPLRYSSSAPAVAVVDAETGVVTGVSTGKATITAVSLNGKRASVTLRVYPAPEYVQFGEASLSLSVGMEYTLERVLSTGSVGSCTFESSDPSVVRVDAQGRVTALSAGTAVVRVHSYNGHSAECMVSVTAAPVKLSYDFVQLTMRKGEIISLPLPTASDKDGNVCPSTYEFKSSNTKVAKVNADGLVKALRTGKTTIAVRSHNGLLASFVLVVSENVPELTLTPSQATLYADGKGYAEQVTLRANTSAALSYTSSNANVAVVSPKGVVTAVGDGSAHITARAANGSYAVAEITVHRLTSSLRFDAASLVLGEGETHRLNPVFDHGTTALVSYMSDNRRVATVDEDGLIHAVGVGSTHIIAAVQNGVSAIVEVEVVSGPDGVSLGAERICLAAGEQLSLQAQFIADGESFSRSLSFASSDPRVATVSADGLVHALAAGTASITATTGNGHSDSCLIEVVSDASLLRIGFTDTNFSIVSGDCAALPIAVDSAAYGRGYSVTSSQPELLTITSDGMLAAAGQTGEAELTMRIEPDPAAADAAAQVYSCRVRVVSAARVILDSSEISMEKNATAQLGYTVEPADLIGLFTCEVSDPKLISYDLATGTISSGKAGGTASISFRTFSGVFSCTVKVSAEVKYRALLIGEFNNSGAKNDLPFARNNLHTMGFTMQYSSVSGERYAIKTAFSNPSKAKVRDLLGSSFAEAGEDDVSLIYIVSHGHIINGEYAFSIAPRLDRSNPNTYVTSSELMRALKTIRGNVILVLDSCYSGGFIDDQREALKAAGNIAVLTAQTGDKAASYYIGGSESTTVEFLTYAFCYGLGMKQRNSRLPSMPADADGNGYVTINEAFAYAHSKTKSLISEKIGSYTGTESGFYVPGGVFGWNQNPQVFIPNGMGELAFYGRDSAA